MGCASDLRSSTSAKYRSTCLAGSSGFQVYRRRVGQVCFSILLEILLWGALLASRSLRVRSDCIFTVPVSVKQRAASSEGQAVHTYHVQ